VSKINYVETYEVQKSRLHHWLFHVLCDLKYVKGHWVSKTFGSRMGIPP